MQLITEEVGSNIYIQKKTKTGGSHSQTVVVVVRDMKQKNEFLQRRGG